MLRLIPKPLHRLAYRLGHGLRTRWWRLTKPRVTGCRILALDIQGRVLLVRHSYGSRQWMPPSGGIAGAEAPIAAAVRELREETGCHLGQPREVAVLEEPLHGAVNIVHLIAGETMDTPRVDGREVVEAGFFAPGGLPHPMPAAIRDRLPQWLTAAIAARPAAPLPPSSPPPPSPKA